MTFAEIQNAVLTGRFSEVKRAECKNWVNYRYLRLWGRQPWTFKRETLTAAVAAGAMTEPTDLGDVIAVFRGDGSEVYYTDPATFQRRYGGSAAPVGAGYEYTIVNGQITVGPQDSGTYTLVQDKQAPLLAGDADVPLIPLEYHQMLVAGGASIGLRRENDPTWQALEEEWQQALADLEQGYLADHRGQHRQMPAYRP